MNDWVIKKLCEISSKITKGTTPANGQGFVDQGINYIKSEAIGYDGQIDKSKFAFIDQDTHNRLERSHLEKNDILFSMAGVYLGKSAIVTEDMLPANTNQALAIIRLKQDLVIPKFINFFLRQEHIIDYVNNMSGQSAQPNINFQEIGSIDILLPSLPEQRAIAGVLSSLDEKIDLLHRQNKTLEGMAEALWRKMFIEEADLGWKKGKLGDYGQIICGKTPSKKTPEYFGGDIPFIKIPDMHGNVFIFETEDSLTEAGKKSQQNKTIPAKSICVSCIATVGLVSMNAADSQTNQQINTIIPRKEFQRYFLFLLMRNMTDDLFARASGGTATDNLNTGDFSRIEITIPSEKIVQKYDELVKNYFEKIYKNQIQIRTLSNLRDALLPKLMSGEVRVKN